jgi:hypothetical protein
MPALAQAVTTPVDNVESVVLVHKYATLGALVLDASVSEQHNYTSRVTQYPVESGGAVSDNIYNEPMKLTIKGVVSNHPLPDSPADGDAQGALETLLAIREAREPIDIVTGLMSYKDMAMTTLNIPRDYKTGDALIFDVSFIKVVMAQTETVVLNKLSTSGKGAAPEANKGKQTPKELPTSVAKMLVAKLLG